MLVKLFERTVLDTVTSEFKGERNKEEAKKRFFRGRQAS
jgi:hypothetical protein